MSALAALYALAAAALAVLGVRSIAALRRAPAPWTIAGWLLSTVYCLVAIARLVFATPAPPLHAEYVDLACMTLAFIVAGMRREPQAEPWWWPRGPGA